MSALVVTDRAGGCAAWHSANTPVTRTVCAVRGAATAATAATRTEYATFAEALLAEAAGAQFPSYTDDAEHAHTHTLITLLWFWAQPPERQRAALSAAADDHGHRLCTVLACTEDISAFIRKYVQRLMHSNSAGSANSYVWLHSADNEHFALAELQAPLTRESMPERPLADAAAGSGAAAEPPMT